MNPRRKMVDVAILLVACLLALGVSEIALRLLIPDTEQYYVHRPGSGTVFLPDTSIIRGVQGPSQFRINDQGVRGRHLDPQVDEYRILTIGGSTTELLLMDEPRTWPAMVEQSLSMSTSLNPLIGYEAASKLVKEAFASGKTIRELCQEKGLLDEATLKEALDPWKMTEPH